MPTKLQFSLVNSNFVAVKQVYFDSVATSQPRACVLETIQEALSSTYGNPSSIHSFGRKAKAIVENTRKTIANELNAKPSEIIFTSGGTEADNLIIQGAVNHLGVSHIITSKIEHHAVTHTVEYLAKNKGIKVQYVELLPNGNISYENLEALLKEAEGKTLVSLMHINNEIGNITDIDTVCKIAKHYNALVHSDTVQSIGHYPWDFGKCQLDFLVASAHKFHGAKGIGFAFIRNATGLKPLLFGGSQERGMRAGTEAVHDIAGMEVAFKESYQNLTKEQTYVRALKTYFIEQISASGISVAFNGNSESLEESAYNLVNICLTDLNQEKADLFTFYLDLEGIACSRGSACQSGTSIGSHVLKEIKADKHPALRLSFSIFNSKEDIDYAIEKIGKIIKKIS
ncbi:cysteine desulfurase [Elysia marginata]|uniref:cysteine desulfurase n=1 Tax=Elysia marginata TaxID=1093978 RepID=A0AAV4F0C6_9GAST|nr:cysteine desulfurase [Elysia marginata]